MDGYQFDGKQTNDETASDRGQSRVEFEVDMMWDERYISVMDLGVAAIGVTQGRGEGAQCLSVSVNVESSQPMLRRMRWNDEYM